LARIELVTLILKALAPDIILAKDNTTDTSASLLSRSKPVASTFAFLERKCRFSLIYATKLLLIKTGFFRDKNSLHQMHSTTGRGRDCQHLDSDMLASKESASTRSAISVPQGCWLIGTEFSVGTAKSIKARE
jgi:hypothetical protein